MFSRFGLTALSRHRSAKFALASLIAIVVISLVAFTARAWRSKLHLNTKQEGGSARQAPASPRVGAELITITPRGFVPAEINRPAGQALLAIVNQTGLAEITLRFDRQGAARLKEERMPKNKVRWRSLVNLHPGNYQMTEANHPDWMCRIVVTP
jgi:hypothetical protein